MAREEDLFLIEKFDDFDLGCYTTLLLDMLDMAKLSSYQYSTFQNS